MEGLNLLPALKPALQTCGFSDDFTESSITSRWNTLAADSGATVATSASIANGAVVLTTGGTDNNEAHIYSNAIGSLASGKNMLALARLQYSEAATDDANVLFALFSGAGTANMLIDDGGGPVASFTGAGFYKVDGGTRWQFRSSVTTTPTTTDLEYTAGGSGYVTLGIELIPFSSTEFWAIPWIDTAGGNNLIQCRAYGASPRTPSVKHRVTYSGTTALRYFVGVKAGGANSEVVNLDLAQFAKKR